MERVNNRDLMDRYIEIFKIDELFSEPMEKYMELFLYHKGEYMCREEEQIDYLLFFVDGKAKVYISLKNGKSILQCFYIPLMVLGDLELVDGQSASSNAEVIQDTYCIALPLKKVREKLINDTKFMRFICTSLGKKLEKASKNGTINLLYPLENRLASYILATSNNHNIDTSIFEGNLTEISELLGTSYRHLLRTLNKFMDEGILSKNDKGYVILNKRKLKEMAADIYK